MSVRNIGGMLAMLGALAALTAGPATAVAAGSNEAATQAYLQATYALVKTGVSHIPASEAAARHVLTQTRQECPQAAASSPENTQATELSNEVIGAMVISAGRIDLGAIHSFLPAVASLRWSDGQLTNAVRSYASKLRTESKLSVPAVCSDVRAWTASGFTTLPATTVAFDKVFMPNWVSLGVLPPSLAGYETGAQKALASKVAQLEELIAEGEARQVETWGAILDGMDLLP